MFPDLRKEDYRVTSEEDRKYNCIAHAADRSDVPWWPVEEGTDGGFWPAGVPREETLDAFVLAYGTQGYVPCDSADVEPGCEKIALYVNADGTPSHAAKQTSSGAWSSKLGNWEDIEHKTLANLEASPGGAAGYGKVARILKRRRPGTIEMEAVKLFEMGELEAERSGAGRLYLEFLRCPALSAGLYELAAGAEDAQRPHAEDEVYYIVRGRASFKGGGQERSVGPGSVIFVKAGEEHRFLDITEDLAALVFFAPAEGTTQSTV